MLQFSLPRISNDASSGDLQEKYHLPAKRSTMLQISVQIFHFQQINLFILGRVGMLELPTEMLNY